MKVYRGYDKEVGPISHRNWIYVTPSIEHAKWYATKDGFVKNGSIIEYDMDKDNMSWIDLDKINEYAEEYDEEYTVDDLLWYQKDLAEDLSKFRDGIYFTDPYDKNHTIFIVLNEDCLKNGRILSPEEFNSIKLRESFYENELNDVLRRAGIQLNEREDLTRFNRIAGFYHYDTKQFELFPRTTEEISTEDDEINDYIHRISSKKELSERHVVRFGIEDIPGEGVICYIEGDTKRNAEECYYAIVDEYQEQCDIIKYEVEYYVGSSKKMIEFDAYGNQIMEGIDRLDEKVVHVNKELTNTRLVTSAYELNEIIKHNTETRVLYDKQKNWFLIDNSEVSIHIELLNDALLDGIYPPFEWNGHICDGTGGDGIDDDGDTFYKMNPNRFVLFRTSSDPNNLMEYTDDRYTNCYYYPNSYCVFDRTGDFRETPLYKLLGKPEYIEHWNSDLEEFEELKESVGGNYLYHGTKLDVLFQILKDNVLQGSESTSGGGYNPYGVSTSRDLNFAYNFADISLHLNGNQDEDCRCVIVLDKDKLKSNYKIIPFRDENAFDVYDDDNTLYPELLEKEEIILGDIQNVRNYIVGIYVSPDCKKLDTPEEIFLYYYNYLSYNELDRNDLETYVNEYADIINIIMNAKTFTNGRSQYNLRNNIAEAVNKGIDFVAYHGGVEPDMIPAKDRPLYLTDSFELAHKFSKREIWNDGLYDGEIPTVFTFKGHFNNPYYMTLDEYNDEGQDSNIDIQKWIEMGVDGIVLPPNEEGSTTYYIVIDLSTIKLVDKKVFYDEADLDDDY